ncbi:hypothetical protein AbraIFM66950_011505 [Aspergillus brasiliensis]|nr:hypothetical protein AbraIFM66950_011505 [Aspergillus brasiliensis]
MQRLTRRGRGTCACSAETSPAGEQVILDTESQVCGLVGFYTDQDEALATFTIHWVPIDDPSDRNLGGFSRGLRTDSLLLVDQEVLQSRDSRRLFVWLWEPKRPSTAGENDDVQRARSP